MKVANGLKIPYGIGNFEKLRSGGYLYVDKTKFLEQMEMSNMLLHLRPRRFGKSLFLSMMDSYYDVASADKFERLFKGLYIGDFPTPNRNNYYMLRFNFSGIETVNPEVVFAGFKRSVKEGLKHFIGRYELGIRFNEEESAASMLHSVLTQFKQLGKKHQIYILIDEYDHFTNAVLTNGLEGFATLVKRGGTVRSFYEIIKSQSELGIIDRFFATGVMSVSLDSMTSGFNISTNITNRKGYATMMGFTSEEVKNLLASCPLSIQEQSEIYGIFKENYNGYRFSETSDEKVFNSTLIMYYLENYLANKEHPKSLVDPNLNQSGTTLATLVNLKNQQEHLQLVEELVQYKTVSAELSDFVDLDKKFDRNDFMTLMFNLGLVTIVKTGMRTQFGIPNKVIESLYLQYLKDLLQRTIDYKLDLSRQESAIEELGEQGRIQLLTQLVEEFLIQSANRNLVQFDEKYIKLLYMMLLSATPQYVVYDEFPARNGFVDLFIQKAPASNATYEALIELKYIKKSDATIAQINKEWAQGLRQMDSYLQDKRLAARSNLKKFVVVFAGSEVVKQGEI